jgi:hypothetical protein
VFSTRQQANTAPEEEHVTIGVGDLEAAQALLRILERVAERHAATMKKGDIDSSFRRVISSLSFARGRSAPDKAMYLPEI